MLTAADRNPSLGDGQLADVIAALRPGRENRLTVAPLRRRMMSVYVQRFEIAEIRLTIPHGPRDERSSLRQLGWMVVKSGATRYFERRLNGPAADPGEVVKYIRTAYELVYGERAKALRWTGTVSESIWEWQYKAIGGVLAVLVALVAMVVFFIGLDAVTGWLVRLVVDTAGETTIARLLGAACLLIATLFPWSLIRRGIRSFPLWQLVIGLLWMVSFGALGAFLILAPPTTRGPGF